MNQYQTNPYSTPQTGYEAAAAYAVQSERVGFIQRTYAHLTAAVFAFAAIEALIFALVPAQTMDNLASALIGSWTWLLFLGGFMVVSWVARGWAESGGAIGRQYMGLSLYVVAEAVLFLPLLWMADRLCGGQVIVSAGVLTLIMFGGLSVIVFATKADFSFLRMFLMWGGILGLGVLLCGALFQFQIGMWFSVLMIGLASGYILYDTSNVLHHYRTDQYVAASLALFASVALLFWYVLRLLISLRSRD